MNTDQRLRHYRESEGESIVHPWNVVSLFLQDQLGPIVVKKCHAVRTVYELPGLCLLNPRRGYHHVARRTTPMLNRGENSARAA